MELVDQYLKSVRPLLPEAQREDILDELSEEIRSQMEAQAAILGRELTEDEQNAVLSRYGHPLIVGGRYQPNQGSLVVGKELISRELFPFYVKTLKYVLIIGLAGISLVHAILAYWEPFRFSDFLNTLALQVLIQVGVVTTLFSVLQGKLSRNPEKWDTWSDVRDGQKETTPIGVRVEAVIQLVITVTIFAWIRYMLGAGSTAFAPGILTPVWGDLCWILGIATVISSGQFVATFVTPAYVRYQRQTRLVAIALWLFGFAMVYGSGNWVTTNAPEMVAQVRRMNDGFFRWGILSMLVTLAFAFSIELWGYVAAKRKTG